MVTQVGNELALALAQARSPLAWPAFRVGLGVQPEYFDGGRVLHQPVQQWLRLKQALAQEDHDGYLVLLADFLASGKRDVAPIWYSSVIDFIDFCQKVASRASLQIRDGILRDSQKWRALPPSLRACLDINRE